VVPGGEELRPGAGPYLRGASTDAFERPLRVARGYDRFWPVIEVREGPLLAGC